MAKKRITPPDDLDRLTENLNNNFGRKITDRESFDKAWDEYLGDEHGLSNKQKDKVWKNIADIKQLDRAIKNVQATQRKARQISKSELSYLTTVKGKRVYARKEFVKVKGKSVVRYRDAKGRFVKKPKEGK